MKKLLLLVLFTTIGTSLFAQKIKKYSDDSQQFIVQISEVLNDLDKDKGEALAIEFTTFWNTTITEEHQKIVIDIANNFIKKRVTDYESYSYFLQSLIGIYETQTPQIVSKWLLGLETTSGRKPAKYTSEFLAIIYKVFNEDVFFEDRGLKWSFENGTYDFDYQDEPVFVFSDLDIKCKSKGDSTIISQAAGVFYPLQSKFLGTKGTLYWTRGGFSQDSLFVELNKYELNTTKSQFEADSAILHSLYYFTEPVMGNIQERLTSNTEADRATFPRFRSYRKDMSIKNIVQDVDFYGGFSIVGANFFGSGSVEEKASLKFMYEGKPIIEASTSTFLLKQELISSQEAEVLIHIKGDSIYHPKLGLNFILESRQLSLSRTKEGLSQTAFVNTYHNLDMFYENFTWKMDEPKMNLSNLNLGGEDPVIFESENYFRDEKYRRLQGLQDIHPLYNLKKVSTDYDLRHFTLARMAKALRMAETQAKIFLMQMSVEGFVYYDLDKDEITIRQKLFDFLKRNEDKLDYDVIKFISGLSQGTNASISLLDYNMQINGVNNIALSDSQEVMLFPKDHKIIVEENLNFVFDGQIRAGRFQFWGNNFKFIYDNFKVNMATIDSMRFQVPSFEADDYGKRRLRNVKNTLQDINGELFIDHPNNKSGKMNLTEYPIFKSGKEAYVYYDKNSIENGVYTKDEFYVRLVPFEIDSLDNITTEGLKFKGTLNSAGIFPDIEEDIMVQEDYSLGFKTQTPPGGYPAYGGKGTFTNNLSLSNKGFRGDGTINYLTSTAVSNDFVFYPDSTNGVAQTYDIREQIAAVEYPPVSGNNVSIHWEPKNDIMYSTSAKREPMHMYADVGMKAHGTLALEPSQLTGKGRLEFVNAETQSDEYLFRNRDFESFKLDFKVKANPVDEWAFSLANTTSYIDFNQRKGEFTLNDPQKSYMEFPVNMYKTYMDYAEWDMDEKSIDVSKKSELPSSLMVSTHPNQDSLRFVAGSAKFYLEKKVLEVFDANEIVVADATIYPDTGYVVIDPKADMRLLERAQVKANNSTRYHQFLNSSIKVKSRNSYKGSGEYDYVDEDQLVQIINFHEIKVDTGGTTIAKGKIPEEDGFFMSEFFAFKGNVHLKADEKYLTFHGATQIQHTCSSIVTTWVPFESVINPTKIVIDLPPADTSSKREKLFNGLYVKTDSTGVYSSFLSRKNAFSDLEMIASGGQVYYDKAKYSYIIAPKEKVENIEARGNYVALNNRDCELNTHGIYNFGAEMGMMKFDAYGEVTHLLQKDTLVSDLVAALDFFLADELKELFAAKIKEASSLKSSSIDRNAYKIAMTEMLDEDDKEEYLSDLALYGLVDKLPKELVNTILFSELHMTWNDRTRSFVSVGDIGIGNIGKTSINKTLKGKIEIIRKRNGDELYMYLEVDNSTFYYFQYKRNIMQIYSSDSGFMDALKALDVKDREKDNPDGGPSFRYIMATKGKISRFLSRFEDF